MGLGLITVSNIVGCRISSYKYCSCSKWK